MNTSESEQAVRHYVCSECGTVSKNPGNCQADFCIMQGSLLKECHCEDGKHEGVKSNWDSEDGPQEESKDENDMGYKPTTTLDLDSEQL